MTSTVSDVVGDLLRLAGVLAVSSSVGMDVVGKLLRLSVRAALGLSVHDGSRVDLRNLLP